MTRRWSNFKRWARLQTITLFRVDDGSERVARGFAIGALINFYPTFGLGIVGAGFLSGLLNANVIAGIVGGTIFTLLWPVIFYLNMLVGDLVFYSPIRIETIKDVDESAIDVLVQGKTFLAGAAVNCIVGTLIVYAVVFFLHSRFRNHILDWLKRLRARRALRQRQKREADQSPS